MKNLVKIVGQIAGTYDTYYEAKTTIKAYTRVLSESLNEGQKLLLQGITDAHKTMRSVESEVLEAIGRCA